MSTQPAAWSDLLEWTFGDRLRKIRRAKNVDQGTFAKAIGETRDALSKWESGRVAQPRNAVAIAKRIQLAYGIPATWTLGIEEAPTQGDPDGGLSVHRPGLEPGTRWLRDADVITLPVRTDSSAWRERAAS